jgi:hypothetical protein
MRKLRLKPPANDTRPTRRSLVELTAAASRAVDDGMLVMPSSLVMISGDDPSRAEELAQTPVRTAAAEQPAAPAAAEPVTGPPARSAALPEPDDTAEMLVQIAKDHQARALDGVRLGLDAMLDYARDLVRTPADRGEHDGRAKQDGNLRAATAYRSEAIDLVKANIATALDYAHGLAGATTSADFVELSSTLARRQCELVLKQAAALQSLARGLTKPGTE